MSGIIYEPRALWSVSRQQPTAVDVPIVARMNREHFRNGWRHPIELTHMLIAPIGYAFREYAGATNPPAIDADRHAEGAAIQLCSVLVRAPQRQLYTLKRLRSTSFTPCPAADVGMRGSTVSNYSAGLTNVCRWDFARPCVLPAEASVDFRLGGALLQPGTAPVGAGTNPDISVGFFEHGPDSAEPGSSFRANSRTKNQVDVPWRVGTSGGDTNFPFIADALGDVAQPANSTSVPWPFRFTGSEYRRMQHGKTGPSVLSGFAVAIDQIAYEESLQTVPALVGGIVESLALRMPAYAKIIDAGSGAEWWREGAPLGLVTPSLSPANVYELDRPITLHKGDTLEVEVEVPGGFLSSAQGKPSIYPPYSIGVSFCGFAAIEG